MALLTVSEHKVLIGEVGIQDDARFTELIAQASNKFEKQVARKIELQTYANDKYDGRGGKRLHLREWPISVVTALTISQSGATPIVLSPVVDLVIYQDEGYIEINIDSLIVTIFVKGQQNIDITYDAGFSPVPDDIKYAISGMVGRMFRRLDNMQGAYNNKAFQGGSVVFTPNMLDDFWKDTVKTYKRRFSVL